MLKGITTGLKSVFHMKNKIEFLIHTLFIWLMYWMMTYVMVFAMPATSFLSPVDGIFLIVIGGLGMSAPVQGGIGAFHWIITKGLTLYDISEENGFSFATLLHESQALFAIFLGIIAFISFYFIKRVHHRKQHTGEHAAEQSTDQEI
jgi:glycosyltransferase 2 family protein